jgi:pyruvate,water dikinase
MLAATQPILTLPQCDDVSVVGGKAVNLGALCRAGFPVPAGFVVTTDAYRAARNAGEDGVSSELAELIGAAYAQLGGGRVAVRSSATAEDMAGASMAGQYETFLNVEGEPALLAAVARCWASLDTPRTRSYLAERGIPLDRVAMAVVVQRQVAADVAGVLFTANPRTGDLREMVVEACWGLGEALVSGKVQPDVWRIKRDAGEVIERRIADKQQMLSPDGVGEESPVPEAMRRKPCLDDDALQSLHQLGLRSAEHFGGEQDLEWAIERGRLYLLQSRAITTLDDAPDIAAAVSAEREALAAALAARQGPWVRHNLGETLPHPTPLTWSVMRQFMSGGGGFGAMYRLAGFEPSPAVCGEGFLRQIAGRIYMDTAAAAGMFFDRFPFRYDLAALRTNPDAAQAPPTIPTGGLRRRFAAQRRLAVIRGRLTRRAETLDQRLRHEAFPAFAKYVESEAARPLGTLSGVALADIWERRRREVLDVFAPQAFLPSLVEGMVLGDLRDLLAELFWDEDSDELARFLSSSPVPNLTLLADAGLFEVAAGRRPMDAWLDQFGHRAAGEFDLATSRWREQPDAVRRIADRLAGGQSPMALHEAHSAAVRQRLAELRARCDRADADELNRRVDRVWRYIVFREDGKFHLMLGYELLRGVALEAGRRLGVGDGVFFLEEQELLSALRSPGCEESPGTGGTLVERIAQRRRLRRAQAKLSLPHLIDGDTLAALGEAPRLADDAMHAAFAVSAGHAAGPARIVRSPDEAGDLGNGYVLVCPSTDPNWTPLFVNAAALVLECGGTLSHGAVVAREMGLPAVVLPDATRLFADGDRLYVDGDAGRVGRADGTDTPAPPPTSAAASEGDPRIAPADVPPPPGRKDRRAARLRNVSLAVWGILLALAFVLPEAVLYRPALRAVDAAVWWMVPLMGKPATVAVVAAGVAILTMLLQRVLVDNARLREARRRAQILSRSAAGLPADSPRARAIARLTTPVQVRVLSAAMTPLAVLLGPMVFTFLWMPARMEPANWSPPPGTEAYAVATVETLPAGETVTLEHDPALTVDQPTQAVVEDVASATDALKSLLAAWQQPGTPADETLAAEIRDLQARGKTADDLRRALGVGIRPRAISWTLRTPADDPHGGRWTVAMRGPGGVVRSLRLVVGDRHPPEDALELLSDEPGIVGIRLVLPRPRPQPFFTPLAGVSWQWVTRRQWDEFDIGWLGVYLLAYLPTMMIARRALRVA